METHNFNFVSKFLKEILTWKKGYDLKMNKFLEILNLTLQLI